MALQWDFLNHRHDYPDPLAAAQHEARTLAQDNAHLVRVIADLEIEKAQIEEARVVAVRSAWFWRNQAKPLGRAKRGMRQAQRLSWLCVALAFLVLALGAALVATAMGWV